MAHNIIGGDTKISGDIISEDDFRIDGIIEGSISCKGKVIIGANSTIIGNINCTNIELLGKIQGNIICSGNVILRNSSCLKGEVKTNSIEMEPGAKLDGSCSMDKN